MSGAGSLAALGFLAIGLGLSALAMLALWALQLRTKNAAVMDAGWALGVAALAALDAWQGWGWGPRRALALGLAGAWGLRLGLYLLATRVWGRPEAGHYRRLRLEWKKKAKSNFLVFFQFQAFLTAFFSLPFLLASLNPRPGFSALEIAAVLLWVLAFTGVWLADRQLHRFKQDRKNRGKTCRAGLWGHSRHPNYFFEWLLWCANALFALASPFGWLALLCPALLLYFLFKMTGIPATEAQALRTKRDYRAYQRATSAFVPWFKKRKA
ncbi:MAG TPA: DUF1295 domain-containing protein [bacterium]|nr:DUF1295 domain-containing protein [bacterium]